MLNSQEFSSDVVWVQCENLKCMKWRKISKSLASSIKDVNWFCRMNPDANYASCKIEQEYIKKPKGEQFIFSLLEEGSLVWVGLTGYPRWPAIISSDITPGNFIWLDSDGDVKYYHVEYFGDPRTHSWILADKVEVYGSGNAPLPFTIASHKGMTTARSRKSFQEAMLQADRLILLKPEERLQNCFFKTTENLSTSEETMIGEDEPNAKVKKCGRKTETGKRCLEVRNTGKETGRIENQDGQAGSLGEKSGRLGEEVIVSKSNSHVVSENLVNTAGKRRKRRKFENDLVTMEAQVFKRVHWPSKISRKRGAGVTNDKHSGKESCPTGTNDLGGFDLNANAACSLVGAMQSSSEILRSDCVKSSNLSKTTTNHIDKNEGTGVCLLNIDGVVVPAILPLDKVQLANAASQVHHPIPYARKTSTITPGTYRNDCPNHNLSTTSLSAIKSSFKEQVIGECNVSSIADDHQDKTNAVTERLENTQSNVPNAKKSGSPSCPRKIVSWKGVDCSLEPKNSAFKSTGIATPSVTSCIQQEASRSADVLAAVGVSKQKHQDSMLSMNGPISLQTWISSGETEVVRKGSVNHKKDMLQSKAGADSGISELRQSHPGEHPIARNKHKESVLKVTEMPDEFSRLEATDKGGGTVSLRSSLAAKCIGATSSNQKQKRKFKMQFNQHADMIRLDTKERCIRYENRKLDLFLFYESVKQVGGFTKAFDTKCWQDICKRVTGTDTDSKFLGLKCYYERILLPFEKFMNSLETTNKLTTKNPATKSVQSPLNTPDAMSNNARDAPSNSELSLPCQRSMVIFEKNENKLTAQNDKETGQNGSDQLGKNKGECEEEERREEEKKEDKEDIIMTLMDTQIDKSNDPIASCSKAFLLSHNKTAAADEDGDIIEDLMGKEPSDIGYPLGSDDQILDEFENLQFELEVAELSLYTEKGSTLVKEESATLPSISADVNVENEDDSMKVFEELTALDEKISEFTAFLEI